MQRDNTDKIERAILGALAMDATATDTAITLGLRPQHFSNIVYKAIYEAIAELHAAGMPIDLVTLLKPCKHRGVSASEIASLTNEVASSAHLAGHIKQLKEEWTRSQIITIGNRIINGDNEVTLADIADFVERESGDSYNRTLPLSSTINESLEEAFRRCDNRQAGIYNYIRTDIAELDNIITGWQPATLYVLAARPGMGKTAFAIAMARRAAEKGKSVLYFTLEMSARRITDRILIAASGVNGYNYRRGELQQYECDIMLGAADKVRSLPIYINDSAIVTTEYIRSVAKAMKAQNQCDMIIIDYLQLIQPTGTVSTREQEVARITRSLLLLAKETDTPILLLAQLSRAVEARQNKRPQLSDLRESGAIEQDADTVIFLYRPDYYDRDNFTGEGIAIVAKNRDGATGDAVFHYNQQMTDFTD